MKNNRISIIDKIDSRFDKINTNTFAQMSFWLIYEFALGDDSPYTNAKKEYEKIKKYNLELLNAKNRKIYNALTNIFSIIDSGVNIFQKLDVELNKNKECGIYYKTILSAYSKEKIMIPANIQIKKDEHKQLVLKRQR